MKTRSPNFQLQIRDCLVEFVKKRHWFFWKRDLIKVDYWHADYGACQMIIEMRNPNVAERMKVEFLNSGKPPQPPAPPPQSALRSIKGDKPDEPKN